MDQIQLEPGPDGHGWWPTVFAVNQSWADDRSGAWRAVTNHPTLQARRSGDLLDLRHTGHLDTVHTYELAATDDGYYIATKEN